MPHHRLQMRLRIDHMRVIILIQLDLRPMDGAVKPAAPGGMTLMHRHPGVDAQPTSARVTTSRPTNTPGLKPHKHKKGD